MTSCLDALDKKPTGSRIFIKDQWRLPVENLAYNSQDAAYVGPKVEEKVREELGASAPFSYQVETGEAETATLGSVLGDIGRALVGGADTMLFRLSLDLPRPRPAHLQINVNRQGLGSHVGMLVYSALLSKPVGGEVTLEEPKLFGKSKFTGDAASAKLNANGDLIKRANSFVRTESQSGGLTLKIKRSFRLLPHENGSLLIIGTLPRPIKMGFSATVDAKDFFYIAEMIETAL
jgi:hypothetical protein